MSLSDKLVKLAEVAQALDRSEDWVKRNWLKLHLEKGMPRKLTVGWSWPRATLERWLEQGADGVPRELPVDEAPAPETPAAPLALIIANQNTRLRGRYAGGRA